MNVRHTDPEEIARERIEQAFRDHVGCRSCGAEMMMLMRDEVLRIECGSLVAKRGIRYSLASALHESHVVELPEGLLAAA